MELETKLAAKETQLQRLQWINKNLAAKLAAANPRIGTTRPSSAYSSKKLKSTPTYETPRSVDVARVHDKSRDVCIKLQHQPS